MTIIYRACSDVSVVYSLRDGVTRKKVLLGKSIEPICSNYTLSLDAAKSQLDQMIGERCGTLRKRLSCQQSGAVIVESQAYPWPFLAYIRQIFS